MADPDLHFTTDRETPGLVRHLRGAADAILDKDSRITFVRSDGGDSSEMRPRASEIHAAE